LLETGLAVEGDYEGLIAARGTDNLPIISQQERAFVSLKDKRWSLQDALLLYGTLSQVQQYVGTPGSEKWTSNSLELTRKRKIGGQSSLHKLYVAFIFLERTSDKLQLSGRGVNAFSEATRWLVQFASKKDGLRVKGICNSTGARSDGDCKLSLALFQGDDQSNLMLKSKASSVASELHKLRQYASLGSALLYLAAKRSGQGRTLTEVCAAFGTFAIVSGKFNRIEEEALVRPKFCSKAMQELKAVLPEVFVLPPSSALGNTQELGASLTPVKSEAVKSEPHQLMRVSSASSTFMVVSSLLPVKSEYTPEMEVQKASSTAISTEESALADLITRMSSSLHLPQSAICAATSVAIQCSRDAQLTPHNKTKITTIDGSGHIRPHRKRPRSNQQTETIPDVIAVSSILLVCTAGGMMQRLARQALAQAPALECKKEVEMKSMSNPLDDQEDPSVENLDESIKSNSKSLGPPVKTTDTKQAAFNSWIAWSNQPPWHRDVAKLEQCAGLPRSVIKTYYSNSLHPRRSYFLGTAAKSAEGHDGGGADRGALLRSVVMAVPLMTLRNL